MGTLRIMQDKVKNTAGFIHFLEGFFSSLQQSDMNKTIKTVNWEKKLHFQLT